MDAELEQLVWQRARACCEYCRMSQVYEELTLEIDHVIPEKHGGPTRLGNLALSCFLCNSFKGYDLAGIDPKTKKIAKLFNPRRHKWDRHFRWDGALLIGRTAIGRTPIVVLRINLDYRVAHRQELIEEGVLPPS